MALDEKGDTPASLDLLEELVESDRFDPIAYELYAQLAARCGFSEKSKELFNKLLENADDNNQKKQIFRILYLLEFSMNPNSVMLLEYCEKYGQLCDTGDEVEEGLYIQFFMTATLNKDAS